MESSKPERPHAQSIARRSTVKESTGKKFARLFLAEDVDDIGEYLVKDLIIPNLKDVFFNFLWTLLWGDRKPASGFGRNEKTQYYKASQLSRVGSMRPTQKKEDPDEANALRKLDVSQVPFASQAEAREVLTAMKMYLDDYPAVPVGYFQELINETGDWTSEYYGWTSLEDARIRPTSRGGWILVLPKPVRL